MPREKEIEWEDRDEYDWTFTQFTGAFMEKYFGHHPKEIEKLLGPDSHIQITLLLNDDEAALLEAITHPILHVTTQGRVVVYSNKKGKHVMSFAEHKVITVIARGKATI